MGLKEKRFDFTLKSSTITEWRKGIFKITIHEFELKFSLNVGIYAFWEWIHIRYFPWLAGFNFLKIANKLIHTSKIE